MAEPHRRAVLEALSELPLEERESLLAATGSGDPALLSALEAILVGEEPVSVDRLDAVPWNSLAAELERRRDPGAAADSLCGTTVGHVRLEERIGRGGMGEVYRGVDVRLGRQVAVKALGAHHRLRPLARARLLREARILAQLEHAAICQIHDLVEADGEEYLVLELVEGQSLRELGPRLAESERLSVATQLADAVLAAHRAGVVHRDLKPENVMLSAEGQVKVLDFGIARPEAADRLLPSDDEVPAAVGLAPSGETSSDLHTARGSVLGTLAYMSPEQARGEEVGPASDIYSLGVLLHELFTGELPYPRLPRLELVQRVSAAGVEISTGAGPALAELLRAQLRADPRLRPVAEQVGERLRSIEEAPRRRRRRRLAVAAAGVVLGTLVVAVVAVLQARRQARRHAEAARVFAAEASEISWRMRTERLAPAHDLRPVDARLREQIADFEGRMAALGELATGPGNAALGRAYLELGELSQAREHFERAWEGGHRTGEVGFGLGQVLGELYLARAAEAMRIGGPEAREQALSAARQELQNRALEALEVAKQEGAELLPYVEGLMALYDENFDLARAKADEARRAVTWLFEADLLEARAYRTEAILVGYLSPDRARAEPLFVAAREAYARAAARGRSSRAALQGRCTADVTYVEYVTTAGLRRRSPAAALARAEESCSAALLLDPEDVGQMAQIEAMWVTQALAAGERGEDPEPLFERAVAVGSRAIDLAPGSELAWAQRAYVRIVRGITRAATGASAQAAATALEAGIDDIRRALEIEGNHPNVSILALGLKNRGEVAAHQGQDPSPWLEECVELTVAENARQGVVDFVWQREAECNLIMGVWEAERGGGHGRVERAVELWRRIGESSDQRAMLGDALIELARLRTARGKRAWRLLEEAGALAAAASEESEADYRAPLCAGRGHLWRSRLLALTGGDGLAEAEAAIDWSRRARERGPHWVAPALQLAAAHLLLARQSMATVRSPAAPLDRAAELIGRLPAEDSRTSLLRAELETLLGRSRARERASPRLHFDRARERLVQLAVVRPFDPEVHRLRAEGALWRAAWLAHSGEPGAAIEDGLEAVDLLLGVDAGSAAALDLRGALLELAASSARGEARARLATAARESFAAACKVNPLQAAACRRGP